jgi:hypothetical protein
LPAGWSLRPLIVFEDEETGETSLEAPFAGPEAAHWSVVTADGGMGDALPMDTSEVLESPAFGAILLHSGTHEGVAELQSDWFPDQEEAGFYHCFRGTSIRAADLHALVVSLELLE